MKVLIVDDEKNIRDLLKRYFEIEGIESDCAENGLSAQRMISQSGYDALVVDLRMPGMDGQQLISWIRSEGHMMPIIMMSAHGEIPDVVKALHEGAQDYIEKPFDPETLVGKLKKMGEVERVRKVVESPEFEDSFIGTSDPIVKIKGMIERISRSDSTVLVTGESGTGKEVVARAIHSSSPVKDGPFMAINIGGVPVNLLESELFGYEKGAFTGAAGRKQGMFELADGGTLFLDEIGDMPSQLQVKLLRVLQERTITRLGGTEQIALNARIIAATNKDLEKRVREGTFREDLYFRLNVVHLELPPLRERVEDIPLLAGAILSKLNRKMHRDMQGIDFRALELLKSYPFYGNVRELENVLERAMIFATGSMITVDDLNLKLPEVREGETALPGANSLKEIERFAIVRALQRWEGNRTRAAKELGISRRTLITKIETYGLEE